MTSLLAAREGGMATDADGEVALYVAPGALNVDTMVTILSEDRHPPAPDGCDVIRSWRIDAYPAPVELNAKASLSHRVADDGAPGTLKLFFRSGHDGERPHDGGWKSLDAVPLGSRWLDAKVWYLPPAAGIAPRTTYTYVCLVREP